MQLKIESFDSPPPNYSLAEHSLNGFSRKLSTAQIASYVVIAASIAIYFSSILPLKHELALLVLYAVFGGAMVVSSAAATAIDPTDRVVYYYKWSKFDKKITFAPEYDKILFCEYCDSYCWLDSKHCRTCNRCVNLFDHHCMWFNNCVGRRNYKHFFVSIISTLAYALTVAAHVVVATVGARLWERTDLVRSVFAWIIGVVLVVFAFLLVNLIFLHIYLITTGQTTYQFLQRKKKEEEEEKKEKEKDKLVLERSSSASKIVPELNQRPSDDCLAHTKAIVIVRSEGEPQQNENGLKKQPRKISNDYFQEQIARHSKKSEEESVKSKHEQNSVTYLHEHDQAENLSENHDRLPDFFRKNKSLKLLLSNSTAQRPSRKKLAEDSFRIRQSEK